ncbi:MAG: di-heme oxidoredictase family protein [Bacteroidota bacterium]
MKMRALSYLILAASLAWMGCSSDDDSYVPLMAEENEEFSGGDVTSFNFSAEAFGFAAPELSFDDRLRFGVGNSLFNQSWVTAPSSTTGRDGLGPFFNARSCSGCHFKDGRGRPPLNQGERSSGLLLRFSSLAIDEFGYAIPDPVYGNQLQDNAILGIEAEGEMKISYTAITVTYPDGNKVILQKPDYDVLDLAYGPIAASTLISPRVANHMSGLGLLEAIPEATILMLSDPSDANGDGISGKPNYVYNVATGSLTLGRFGWKANMPNVNQQVAGAFSGDLGITSNLFPDEFCPPQINCNEIPNGGTPEIPDENLSNVTFYASTLAVPARRNFDDPNVLEGKALFNQINCAACHIPKLETGAHPIDVLANQTIRPYTDLLLHDMGPELADGAPEFDANGREWRTPPLWGIGLFDVVNDHTNLLHDGRARNFEEAILWHGGEAENSKLAFMQLTAIERSKIIEFLNSL